MIPGAALAYGEPVLAVNPVVVMVIGGTIVVTGSSRMEPSDVSWKGQLAPAVMGGWWLFFFLCHLDKLVKWMVS